MAHSAASMWLLLSLAAAAAGSVAAPLECTNAAEYPLWPTFHLFNNISRGGGSDGRLEMEGLNDCNAVLEYKGIYHHFVQGGLGRSGMVGDWSTGGWTHAVPNDLVRWFHVKEALGRGRANSSWDHDGPCDGTLTLTDGAGAGPFIMYALTPFLAACFCCSDSPADVADVGTGLTAPTVLQREALRISH